MPDLVEKFAALGDATRLAIVEKLMAEGPKQVADLLPVAKISAPAVSRHLKVLREAGLITQKVDAQRRIYAVDPKSVTAIKDWVLDHEEFWTGSLDRLAIALGEED